MLTHSPFSICAKDSSSIARYSALRRALAACFVLLETEPDRVNYIGLLLTFIIRELRNTDAYGTAFCIKKRYKKAQFVYIQTDTKWHIISLKALRTKGEEDKIICLMIENL
jgi:hypothetical protein